MTDSRITPHAGLFHVLSNGVAYNYVGVVVSALLEITVGLKTLVTEMLRYCKVKHCLEGQRSFSSGTVWEARFVPVHSSPLTEMK